MSLFCLQRDVLDQIEGALLAGGRRGEHVEGGRRLGGGDATSILISQTSAPAPAVAQGT